ncbi:hypothetical protein V6N11_070420 [Hibiscus sabdariffa]|uniref:PGG domain-containing protein n=1 Tax=Hibiscus sabdariffa TaxID=183260 RepID=A0ABR2QFC5_9ROSI
MNMETPWNGIVIGNAARSNDVENEALKNYMENEARRDVMENTALRNYVKIAAGRNIIGALYASIRRDPTVWNGYDEVPFENTPLHIAASRGNTEFAMEMMNLKPSFAKKLDRDGSSPLHLALGNNRLKMVRLLVNADKDLVRVKGREGVTPFHQAVAMNNLNAVAEFLVACPECIVDVNIRGQTALHIAARGGMVNALQILVHWLRRNIHKDGDVWQNEILNSKDNEGNTVLHVAATNNHPQMIRLLLNRSVDKNLKNSNNLTPLDILQHQANAQEARNILQSAGGLYAADIPDIPTLPDFLQTNITFYELMCKSVVRQQMNISNKTRRALLVVAGLMLTATYNASLNPPGGISPGPQNSTGDFHNSTTDSTASYLLKGLAMENNPVGKSVMTSRACHWHYWQAATMIQRIEGLSACLFPESLTAASSSSPSFRCIAPAFFRPASIPRLSFINIKPCRREPK